MNSIKKIKLKYSTILLIFVCILFGFTFQSDEDIYDKINRNMETFGRIYKEIALNYVDELDVDKFFKAGVEGMLETLDPYTTYYDDKSRDAVDLITTGKYGGVGITIGIKDSLIRITDVMSGYEAQRKGMRIGDIIKEIDGIDISGSKVDKIRQMVRGTPNTRLTMKIDRDGEIINFDLIRQEISLKNVSYAGFIGDNNDGIAYIKLERFTNNTANEVENALKTFKSKGNLKGIILDLRDNGGGLLESALEILEKFVERNNLLLTTRGNKKESERKFFSKETPLIEPNIPLAILINQNTASASEIVAGAIQDLDRGVIVGSKSFGKGLVQQIKELNDDSRLKITVSRYFTPSGRWIQEKNYFKENKSGVFLNIENFSQVEFKTLNGRIVTANGGITPDVVIKIESESEIHSALLMKDMFFKFANFYVGNNPGVKIFKCTDNEYELFKKFIAEKNFSYFSEANIKINDLKQIALKRNYQKSYMDLLNQMEIEVESIKNEDYDKAKEEIKRSIEIEINKKIINEREQMEAGFENDIQLLEAIKTLKDPVKYAKLLGKG